MGEGKHTLGEWHVEDPMGSEQGDALWVVSDGATSEVYDWRCVAMVTSDDSGDMDCSSSPPILRAERDANARLIAAAPDILSALIEAAEFIQPFNRAKALLDKIDAVIAKATGVQL